MPKQRPTVAVIGGINRDEVLGLDGRLRRGWGGILYNIAALRKLSAGRLRIRPIAYLGRDAAKPVGRWLHRLRNVDCGGLLPLARRGNLCRLRYLSAEERDEQLLHLVPPLTYRHVRPALSADLILVNFISGRDVTLSALERLRTEYHGPMYIDVHSYLLGRRRDGNRFPRRPKNWLRLLACADVLQMNELEFSILARSHPDPEVIEQWARRILTPLRCRCLLVTLASRGAFCVLPSNRTWKASQWPSGARFENIDPTGAGDTFSGAWISCWLKEDDPVVATTEAARRAANPTRPKI